VLRPRVLRRRALNCNRAALGYGCDDYHNRSAEEEDNECDEHPSRRPIIYWGSIHARLFCLVANI
jgi:hypothetical protein